MPLDPDELEQIIGIREGIARIEVHIERMDEENGEKFGVVHHRIDRLKDDLKDDIKAVEGDVKTVASKAGLKAGAGTATVIGTIIAAILAYLGIGKD